MRCSPTLNGTTGFVTLWSPCGGGTDLAAGRRRVAVDGYPGTHTGRRTRAGRFGDRLREAQVAHAVIQAMDALDAHYKILRVHGSGSPLGGTQARIAIDHVTGNSTARFTDNALGKHAGILK